MSNKPSRRSSKAITAAPGHEGFLVLEFPLWLFEDEAGPSCHLEALLFVILWHVLQHAGKST